MSRCTDCILDLTDACPRGSGRAIDDEICDSFIPRETYQVNKYEALQPMDGRCPDCGAFIDVGQHKISINGYADIYKGCLDLLDGMVERFNHLLSCCDIDVSDYYDDEVEFSMHTSEIVDRLFTPYVGGTSKANLKKALGITDDEITWTISRDEVEE